MLTARGSLLLSRRYYSKSVGLLVEVYEPITQPDYFTPYNLPPTLRNGGILEDVHIRNPLRRVLAISQILLGWKNKHDCETDELPNPRPPQPKKN